MILPYNKEEKQNRYQRRDRVLKELSDNEAFFTGLICGIRLFQQKIVTAHKRREHIMIDDTSYYIQSGRERLQEAIDKICK